ncbi:sensor histidine kinase [Kibdelosporangium aridum]|uniref:histidine kinase n=1 Tax=Kibdelosporangium aridum TaxID=2030 RepID=A0A1Y5Y3J8_KIBAR|nr:nitrate- and nitrite sensing domain-containing protein [Kibdelosporangium aridum]SMD24658.1 Signal transduction histidine kinase [Kibdelosporangium aridum]
MYDRPPAPAQPHRRLQSLGTRLRLSTLTLVALLGVTVLLGVIQIGLPSLKLKIIGDGVQEVSVPAVPALAELQAERQHALAYLAAPGADAAALRQQETRTSQGLEKMQKASEALSGAPPEITDRLTAFTKLLDRLPEQRGLIESRSASPAEVFSYYNEVLDAATRLFDAQARFVPDVEITQSAIAAVGLFRVSDNMSRAGSLAVGALANQTFAAGEYQRFQHLVGAYHNELDTTAQYLEPGVRDRYTDVVEGSAYQRLSGIEDALIARGPDPHRSGDREITVSFPVSAREWTDLTSTVSRQLVDLTVMQATTIAGAAADTGSEVFWTTALLLGALAAAAVAAAIVGVRLARRVSRRLGSLAQGVHRVATDDVPELVRVLQEDDDVDVRDDVVLLDEGPDEIGGVAARFRDAVVADLEARRREILLRKGTTRVLKELAHRIQLPVARLLSTVLAAQEKEQNPAVLRLLYGIDHEVVRARRIADHMIVLAGDQPRRQRRNPVPLFHIVQGAATETSPPEGPDPAGQLQRFSLQNIPEVSVKPLLAHQVAHVLSELMDNAVRYSPPGSQIRVLGELTAHGVAIEIADAGMGLSRQALESVNELMRNPPEFDVMVREDAIGHLGFFVVAHLSRALGMIVAFQTSAFQGLSAVVTLPSELLASFPQEEVMVHGEDRAAPAESTWFGTATETTAEHDLALVASSAGPGRAEVPNPIGSAHDVGPRHARPPMTADPVVSAPNGAPPPLPRRRRGASLQSSASPGMVHAAASLPPDEIDVANTRSQLSQLQRGTERGRQAAAAEPGPPQSPAWPREDEESRQR